MRPPRTLRAVPSLATEAELGYDAYLDAIVAAAPIPSPEQAKRLARLLRPYLLAQSADDAAPFVLETAA